MERRKDTKSDITEAVEQTDPAFSGSVCSTTDFTGLMPTPPASGAELESYEEMYQFCLAHPPKPEQL